LPAFDGCGDPGTIIVERGDCAQSGFAFNGCTVTLLAICNPLVDHHRRRQYLGIHPGFIKCASTPI
jgi:hypothetical protein